MLLFSAFESIDSIAVNVFLRKPDLTVPGYIDTNVGQYIDAQLPQKSMESDGKQTFSNEKKSRYMFKF